MGQRIGNTFRAALLAISAYALPDSNLAGLEDPSIEEARRRLGGQLSLQPITRTRWYIEHVENAEWAADAGDMLEAGRLCRAMDRDGVLAGLLATRAGGLVQLPKVFDGPLDMIERLQEGGEQARSEFAEMCPPTELEAFVSDFIKLNLAVAELVPVEGRSYPLFVRRLPEYLTFRWSENRWYFRSAVGLIPITPGDGRWVLLLGGRESPWQRGTWRALGRAFVEKEHADMARANFERTVANPARVGIAPAGATEGQLTKWFKRVAAWGYNTVFAVKAGWDVKLLESNGQGAKSFPETIDDKNEEFQFLLHGQIVTGTGGVGFANADVFDDVKADLIQRDGDAVSHCISTQVLPVWVVTTYGEERLDECPVFSWDTTPPSDLASVGAAMTAAATAAKAWNEALTASGLEVDAEAFAAKFGIPVRARRAATDAATSTSSNVVPMTRVTKVDEASALRTTSKRLRAISARSRVAA